MRRCSEQARYSEFLKRKSQPKKVYTATPIKRVDIIEKDDRGDPIVENPSLYAAYMAAWL